MADGGRHLSGNNDNDEMGSYGDWDQLDWLEETPPPARQPRPAQQRPAQSQQRPAQGQQRPAQSQQRPAQRPVQGQQRPAQRPVQGQQRPAQRPVQGQQRPAQRPAQGQQRPAQRPAQPRQGQPVRERRYMEVEPEPARPARKQPRASRNVEVVEPAEYRPKRRRRSNLPLILLIVVLVGGIAFAGVKLGGSLLKYHRDRSAYDSLSDEALSGLAEPNATHTPDEEQPVEEQQQGQSQAPFAVNWDYLKSVNSDVVGWIYCEGTRINYPVAQTGDNDYYLHRDFTTQEPNFVGTLFVDYNATLGVNLSNLIIYGHHMQDGSMFASLEEYASQEYYQQHPVMYFLTPNQDYRIDLIGARIVEAEEENYPVYFLDESAYANYQYNITATSFFRTSANVTTNYQLVSLSTCDYTNGYQNPRFLVQGLLVPIG